MTTETQPSQPSVSCVKPESGEYAPYHETYLVHATDTDVLVGMHEEWEKTLNFLRAITEEEALVRHAPYTWTVRQVVSHIVDTERIFAYRALRIARGDTTPRAGFDENAFALVAERDGVTIGALADDYESCRIATIAMYRALPAAGWRRRGTANGFNVSVRALAWVTLGHERHHMRILRQRLGRA